MMNCFRLTTLGAAVATALVTAGCYDNFGPGEKITTIWGSTSLHDAAVTALDGTIHVVARSGAFVHHYYSDDDGDSWTSGGVIDAATAPDHGIATEVVLGTYDDYLYAVYTADAGDGEGSIVFIRSTDGGDSWDSPQSLRTGDNPKEHLHVAAGGFIGREVVIAWREFDEADQDWTVRTRVSEDRGENWNSSVEAAYGQGTDILGIQFLDSSTLVLLYGIHSGGDRYRAQIRSKRSTDRGDSWDDRTQVNGTDYGKSYDILGGDLALNGDGVLVAAWATNYDLQVAATSDGETWSDHEVLSTSDGTRRTDVALVFPDGFPAVLSYVTERDIYYRENLGTEWEASRRLNNFIDGTMRYAGMVANGENLTAVWLDAHWEGLEEPQLTSATAIPAGDDDENFSVDILQGTTFSVTGRNHSVEFDIRAGNWSGNDSAIQVWLEADGDNGLNKLLNLWTLDLTNNEEEEFTYSITVPSGTPLQAYTLTAYCGAWQSDYIVDQDAFSVTVEE